MALARMTRLASPDPAERPQAAIATNSAIDKPVARRGNEPILTHTNNGRQGLIGGAVFLLPLTTIFFLMVFTVSPEVEDTNQAAITRSAAARTLRVPSRRCDEPAREAKNLATASAGLSARDSS